MKKLSGLLLILVASFSFGQNIQNEIDRQIWVPFTKAWESDDAKAYNDLHTDDVWRVTPRGFRIGAEYKNNNTERMGRGKNQERKRKIEFWFENRLANGDNAYEVGYYRITDSSGDEVKYSYGRFHICLKKVDGKWKISLDWDTSSINGREITASDYAKGESKHYE